MSCFVTIQCPFTPCLILFYKLLLLDIITYDRQVCADKWWADADKATQEDYGRAHFKMPMRRKCQQHGKHCAKSPCV